MKFRNLLGAAFAAALLLATFSADAMSIRQGAAGGFTIYDDVSGQSAMHIDEDQVQNQPGRVIVTKTATLARTDTIAKNLFSLPANAIPLEVMTYWTSNSDASLSAAIVAGYSTGTVLANGMTISGGGAGNELLSSTSVKTGNGVLLTATGSNLFSARWTTVDTTITGRYTETGTASANGGPFTIMLRYYRP